MSSPKRKKQHFVPKFYLDSWSISDKKQVFVYDKKIKESRINRIDDVAEKNYFYNANLAQVFPELFRDNFKKGNYCIEYSEDSSQIIEEMLSKYVETPVSPLIKKIIEKVNLTTPWERDNCYFITEEEKHHLSVFLSFQFLRVNAVRSMLELTTNRIIDKLIGMGIPEETIKKHPLSRVDNKRIHLRMLINDEHITTLTNILKSYIWILGINKSEKLFYTSDNPITTISHIKDSKYPIIPMNGIASPGVEVCFPLSPTSILLMYDSRYHTKLFSKNRRYYELNDSNSVDYYNSYCIYRAERQIISHNGDFELVELIRRASPTEFDNIDHKITN